MSEFAIVILTLAGFMIVAIAYASRKALVETDQVDISCTMDLLKCRACGKVLGQISAGMVLWFPSADLSKVQARRSGGPGIRDGLQHQEVGGRGRMHWAATWRHPGDPGQLSKVGEQAQQSVATETTRWTAALPQLPHAGSAGHPWALVTKLW
ncbi:MAG: hypothetical protein JRN05_02935 [Nitrososphaerota archaeon]|nr:hypothetical protein [Nitrososphaerota archaeon]MDG6959451.1 hypothetical protein [Nitrososphaerota archaeon]MDG6968025.1 hypothetical protein [Nitrososphaerota archaeon]MDG6969310.1 hypothetical protein [Nitrososphaerota archaeon]MDG7015317.1 hypothetical protein [Nitrososphaerota archaeon]